MPLASVRCAIAAIAGATALAGVVAPVAQADSSCPDRAQCGTVTVPLDRANPGAGTVDVAYALVPRSDASSPAAGTVAVNPGGPGQSTIASVGLYQQGAPDLWVHRDLLLVDPRGTGGSGLLTCPKLTASSAVDQAAIARICGPPLGARAARYGSADVADDIDAVRAALGIEKLDLWGDSYGTFLMQVYAARHPDRVRSVVLDGAFPIEEDMWGRDVLRGTRRVVRLACARTKRCEGRRLLSQIARLAIRLRRHPLRVTAATKVGRLHVTVGERELAELTFAEGRPERLVPLPAAVADALRGRFGRLEKLAVARRVAAVEDFLLDPSLNNIVAGVATMCHDYSRPYDLAAPPATRRAQYRRRLAALDRGQFAPFSPAAWLGTSIDAGAKCLDWPADPNPRAGVLGLHMPDVPVLVMSGDLDSNTPIEQGRVVAAEFPHPTFAVVANAGHTPALDPCGVSLGVEFVENLAVDANRCRSS